MSCPQRYLKVNAIEGFVPYRLNDPRCSRTMSLFQDNFATSRTKNLYEILASDFVTGMQLGQNL